MVPSCIGTLKSLALELRHTPSTLSLSSLDTADLCTCWNYPWMAIALLFDKATDSSFSSGISSLLINFRIDVLFIIALDNKEEK